MFFLVFMIGGARPGGGARKPGKPGNQEVSLEPRGARRSQEEPGGAGSQGSQEPLGTPRSPKALPGPSWPSLAFPGSSWLLLGARKSQEEEPLAP